MNESQMQAVNSDAQRLLVLAGAGTGKTTTMLARISRLVESGVSPDSILVLTFTSSAACDMKERYTRDHEGASPQFCTFHSFCYRLIITDSNVRRRLNYSSIPSVASTSDIKRIKETCIMQCGTKLSTLKLEGKIPLKPSEKFQYDIFWKRYDQMLRQQGLITFDIMCYEVGDLFVEHDPSVKAYADRYKYVFVDEFQDTDHRQWDFVRSFDDSSIFVVGDVKQELYAFRDADPEIIKSLACSHDWQTIKLSENYRSTTEICDFANKIHDSIFKDKPYNLMIHGQKSGDRVQERPQFDLTMGNGGNILVEINSALVDNKSVAILCRSNQEVKDTIEVLNRVGVPCRTNSDQDSFFQIIKSAVDRKFAVEWLSGKLNQDDYGKFLKVCAFSTDNGTYESFVGMYGDKFRKTIDYIDTVSKIIESEDFPVSKLIRIFAAIKLRQPKITESFNTTEDVVQFMLDYLSNRNSDTGVYVGTIHSVKGLEFDVVHLIGVDGEHFPLSGEDNLNCYYVGVTRAKDNLYVYYG